MQQYGVIAYVLLLSIHLYTLLLDLSAYQTATKLLLLPLLIGYLLVQENEVNDSSNKSKKTIVIMALFFSWVGDALLTKDNLFIPGMIAFLLTHLLNISFFLKVQPLFSKKDLRFYLISIALVLFCWLIFDKLKDNLGALIVPILIYMITIAFSTLMSVNAAINTKATMIAKLFWTPGMYFFMASDTVLAINKFIWAHETPKPHINIVTMATYGIAQLLLVKGFQVYFKKKD